LELFPFKFADQTQQNELQARGRIVFDYQSASNDGKNIKASLNDQLLKKITIDFPASLKASLERSDLNGFKLTFPADPTVSVMFHDLPAIGVWRVWLSPRIA
jgi:hypothetical protein